jgi:CubicO group peptidase (beta-lactamase class C family)
VSVVSRSAAAAAVLVIVAVGCGSHRASTVEAGDRWPVSTPAAEGMDAALVRRADLLVRLRSPSLVAVLVVRHGRIVYERYRNGYSRTAPLDLFSITKSVTSAALGLAIADGRIAGVDEPVTTFFPVELASPGARRVRSVTLRDLLTMTAGFPGDPPSLGPAAPAFSLAARPLQALLARPLTGARGRFAFDSGSSQLVADAVARAEEMPMAQLVRDRLFRPLGIADDGSWPRDADAFTWGYSGLRLTARDLAKLGYLYLRGGRWGGKRILPAAWVRASTSRQVRTPFLAGYGYFWWRVRIAHADGFAALGEGGQALLVVPRRDLVVVVANFFGPVNRTDPLPLLRLLVAAART